jgi:hypothetical protein
MALDANFWLAPVPTHDCRTTTLGASARSTDRLALDRPMTEKE